MGDELRNQVIGALTDAQANAKRAGSPGPSHCFFDGVLGKFSRCECRYREFFGCTKQGRFVCPNCQKYHEQISAFIYQGLSFPITPRADSRRRQFERELYDAAVEVCGGEDYDPDEPNLAFHLAQADVDNDSSRRFERKILSAFDKSKFRDFRALHEALEREKDQSLVRAIRRILVSRRRDKSNALNRVLTEKFLLKDAHDANFQRLAEAAISKATASR